MADQLSKEQKEIINNIVKEAKAQGIDPEFAVALANLESGFKHVPASDKDSTAFGPFQVNKATAKANNVDYDEMVKNPQLAIETGIKNIVRHAKNPLFEGDPARIAAAHRYGEGSDFAKTGDLEHIKKDPVLRDYLIHASEHFDKGELPESIYKEPKHEEKSNKQPAVANTEEPRNVPINSFPQPQTEVPRAIAGAMGAAGGAGVGGLLGTKAALLRSKYDIAQLIASYPDAKAAFLAGKSPSEVAAIALKHVSQPAPTPTGTPLPEAQGPLTGNPAGGYQTQNWVASGDTQGRYSDVGMNARDKAEAHQMKLKAMAAEDKIRQIAPEFAPDVNRAGLFIPQGAGRGPSPRFGGTPNVPIAPVAQAVSEAAKPSLWSGLTSLAKNYTPVIKYPAIGALAGLNFGQGMADAYNKFSQKKYGEGALSLGEQGLGYLAPRALGALELGLHSGELNQNEQEELARRQRMAPTITGQQP